MEPPHQHFGNTSEELAASYLKRKGFTIIKRNYRYKKWEIDIIAQKEKLLLFVEVKARNSIKFGYPETFVNKQKQIRLQTIAENYIINTSWNDAIRFDIISILKQKNDIQITHIEDAFS
jgi:putative endonuclease